MDESITGALGHIQEFGLEYPNVWDSEGLLAISYGVARLPVKFFIDAEGGIVERWEGPIDEAELRNALKRVVAGRRSWRYAMTGPSSDPLAIGIDFGGTLLRIALSGAFGRSGLAETGAYRGAANPRNACSPAWTRCWKKRSTRPAPRPHPGGRFGARRPR